jgi:primosomal protein N' (replication factor Y)
VTGASPALRVARVVPDVTGLDKEFDYAVPAGITLSVGTIVRVPLHARRVRGWVIALDPADGQVAPERLQPVTAVASLGPEPGLVSLAAWASRRWAAGRLRPFLHTASPPTNVVALPSPAPAVPVDALPTTLAGLVSGQRGDVVVVVPPAVSPLEAIVAACADGPALLVMPSVERAAAMAAALARRSLRVAVVPREWARAAAGVDVVVGARAAAWAPCPGLATAIVVDEHDESLQEERAPTWHARDVLVERARRAGARVVATSPCPTVTGVGAVGGALVRFPVSSARLGWPIVEVVDRGTEEPWKTSLVTPRLIAALRTPGRRVVCVHNTPGRGRILACRACRALLRCETCAAAVALADDSTLHCPRCGTDRPAVCQVCGRTSFANLRPGVTRLREELEAAAGRPVVAVTGRDEAPPPDADVFVGTEAVLHRVSRADVVAFLDIDHELLAPRYRAAEQAMTLLVRAARLLGPRERGGRLLVQTFLPDHEVIRAAVLADPTRLLEPEGQRRHVLGLPPEMALAEVSGPGSDQVADQLRAVEGITVGGAPGRHLVRAATWDDLGAALVATTRPKGARVRIAVDPPRV